MTEGRIGRFLRAARTLLWMQLAAAALAVGLAVWAVLAVRDLAAERDRLQERVAQLESHPVEIPSLPPELAAPEGNGNAPAGPAPSPPPVQGNLVQPAPRPADVGPQPLPPPPIRTQSPEPTPAPTPAPTPTDPSVGRPDDVPDPPPTRPRPTACDGSTATDPRCRPGRWTILPGAVVPRPVIRRPLTDRRPATNRQEPIR